MDFTVALAEDEEEVPDTDVEARKIRGRMFNRVTISTVVDGRFVEFTRMRRERLRRTPND